jgi:hypothetical protein
VGEEQDLGAVALAEGVEAEVVEVELVEVEVP